MNTLVSKIDEEIERLQQLNDEVESIVVEILIKYQHIIIDMNVEEQLFLRGVDSNNIPLIDENPYSPFTIQIKKQKGQPTNRVTLRDTGDFHASFTVKRSSTSIKISANDNKTFDLTQRYGDSIFGLIPENFEEIRDFYVFKELIEKIKNGNS